MDKDWPDINSTDLPRNFTRPVSVGGVSIGGGAPVAVQSMTNTDTGDAEATLAQIGRLAKAGCEIIRCAVPNEGVLDSFSRICEESPLPVVADIHFDHRLAIEAARCGASGLRINPGNVGSFDRVDQVIDVAAELDVPIRIGVNAGSLALSAQAHDVNTTLQTYSMLSSELPQVPLHLGVTEAGTLRQGTIKSAVGLGALLEEGIGDTVRVSLTADPVEEISVAWEILSALGMRRRSPELVSCPTCGRTQVDVMGCAVNGPGEARGADIGVACGRGQGLVFVGGETVRKVPEDEIVDALFEEIEKRFG